MEGPSNDLLKEMEQSSCPPLDPALFAAVVSDFDLTDPIQVERLRADLKALKESALEQENLPFDPSGTSGLHKVNSHDVDAIHSEQGTSRSGNEIVPTQTDATSMLSYVTTSEDSGTAPFAGGGSKSRAAYTIAADGSLNLFGATFDEKVAHLTEMFPSLPHLMIEQTLRKHGADISRSMDVLLNLSLFNESADMDGAPLTLPKGIDGFTNEENNAAPTPKKGKKSRKRRHQKESPKEFQEEYMPADAANPNKWEAGQKDIDFICSRTSVMLKRDRVSSAYHANGMSLAATIRALAIANAPQAEHEIQKDALMAVQVAELAQEFPTTTLTTLAGLLVITQNVISAANELAAKMTSQQAPPAPLSEIIKFTAPPVDLGSEEAPIEHRKSNSSTHSYDQARASASAEFAAGQEAFTKASQAYRRGTSDPLMRQAAAYYRNVGNEHIAKAKSHSSAASDAIVAGQSSGNVIDLHGVPVQDAVRIARQRVAAWWELLGDSKYMHGGSLQAYSGLQIITGVGRHSRDGTSRLGPAVRKMLEQEGWRVQDGGGHLTVTGSRRR